MPPRASFVNKKHTELIEIKLLISKNKAECQKGQSGEVKYNIINQAHANMVSGKF